MTTPALWGRSWSSGTVSSGTDVAPDLTATGRDVRVTGRALDCELIASTARTSLEMSADGLIADEVAMARSGRYPPVVQRAGNSD